VCAGFTLSTIRILTGISPNISYRIGGPALSFGLEAGLKIAYVYRALRF
jgi:hypothetical protein